MPPTTPPTPRSQNPSASSSASPIRSGRVSPSRIPTGAGMSKPLQVSPFFSSPPSRGGSPSKLSDFELIGDDEVFVGGEPADMGNDTVCSSFSDVTIGHYASGAGVKDGENNSLGKRPPKKSRPQTPTNRQPQPSAVTPKTTRPGSRHHNNMHSPPDSPVSSPHAHNQTTNLLVDFTQQFEALSSCLQMPQTPSHRRTKSSSPTKEGTSSPSKFALPPATPTEKKFFNLLDFSPGVMATPRSVPSVTPREVEQLKASFATQLSQLRAELHGRGAEISGLRDALRQSEERYAEANDGIRQQEDEFEAERNNWRTTKVELRQLFEDEKAEKETLMRDMSKREDELRMLRERAEDALKELADAKRRVANAEEDTARAKKEADTAWKHAEKTKSSAPAGTPSSPGAANLQTEIEKVARELHTLYRAKHETKVSALKKSYEARWEKKVLALQSDLEVEKGKREELEMRLQEKREEISESIKCSTPNPDEVAGMKKEIKRLTNELETERREKGELVGAVEELLAIQASGPGGGGHTAEEREKVSRRVARVSGVGFGASALKGEIERMGGGRERK